MEHRWSQRRPVQCEVQITYPRNGQRTRGTARDISIGGIFVETGPETPPVDALVELSFSLHSDADIMHKHILGQVVHVSPTGVGIMFCDLGVQDVRFMRAFLYGGREEGAARP